MRVRRSALAFAAIAAFATFAPATADTTCPSDSRDNNPPQPFSGLAASSDPPTMVASSGISADVIAALNEGHQVTINFTGGAFPTYAFVVELGGDDAAYASMETSFQSMAGSEATGTSHFNREVGNWKVATDGFQYKGLGALECACSQTKETAAALYYSFGSGDDVTRIGSSAIHEMAHAVQMMKGDQPPVWLVEGGAVHLDCLLNKKLSSSSTSYRRMMTSEGGMFSDGIIEGFLAYYASPHGQSTGLKGGETWCDSESPCGTADTVATINRDAPLIHGMQVNAQLLFYHVGAIATAWAIHNANKTSATLWQSSSEGFWNAITPWDGYGGNGWTSDCPEDKGWKKAFTSFSGHDDMDAFYSAFHAWATTATESDVLAILESDEDVEAMYSDVFDPQCAMSGTAHDPCGAEIAAAESEDWCWVADASAASTVTSGAADGTDELANESSAGAGIAQFRTLGTMLAAAATFTV